MYLFTVFIIAAGVLTTVCMCVLYCTYSHVDIAAPVNESHTNPSKIHMEDFLGLEYVVISVL